MKYFKDKELTEEEQEIDNAMESHKAAKADERMFMTGAWALYLVGFPLFILSPSESSWERVGMAIALTGLLTFILALILSIRTHKKLMQVKEVLQPYLRKKAQPFYNELLEMFADKPGVILHLDDDGHIRVIDNRKKED